MGHYRDLADSKALTKAHRKLLDDFCANLGMTCNAVQVKKYLVDVSHVNLQTSFELIRLVDDAESATLSDPDQEHSSKRRKLPADVGKDDANPRLVLSLNCLLRVG